MSRRTRIARDIRHRNLGTNHHLIYSTTSTSFPSSYSLFGSPVSMPALILPLWEDNKINYVTRPEQLLYNQCPLINLEYEKIRNSKSANLTIAGKLIQDQSSLATKFLFFLSLLLCCLLTIFRTSWFRRRFYSRYKTTLQQYRKLSGVLNQLQNCETLIINIQDNQLNEQKLQVIEQAIINSMIQDSRIKTENQLRKKQPKRITVRNFCYFMDQIDMKRSFKRLIQSQEIQFIFVWEKKVIRSNKFGNNTDSESLLGSIFGI